MGLHGHQNAKSGPVNLFCLQRDAEPLECSS